MEKLRARFGSVIGAALGDEAFQTKVQYLDGVCVFRKGRIVAGYANLPDTAQAVARATQLFVRLP
jgi:hypothetical protein